MTNVMQLPDLKGRVVALIGGAGFIGHHLALALRRHGAQPHVIDSLQVNNMGAFSSGWQPEFNNDLYFGLISQRLDMLRAARIPLHVIDARDYHMLNPCLQSIKPDIVVQLAAIAHANRANKDPFSTFDHSLRTLENTLDSIRSRSPHFIFFSSSMVYGNFNGEEVTEDRRCEPLGIYGALKYSGELMTIAYHQVFGLPYTIVRPSALYGERCVSRRVGQLFIESLLSDQPITVYGDGSDALDFTYVEDLVQGLLLAMTKKEAQNEVFNLTFGRGRTIDSMVGLLREEFPQAQASYAARDQLMPERGTLSVDKARRLLGYEPQWPLEDGFRRYISWYKGLNAEQPALFRRMAPTNA